MAPQIFCKQNVFCEFFFFIQKYLQNKVVTVKFEQSYISLCQEARKSEIMVNTESSCERL